MSKSKIKRSDTGAGADFINAQRARDEAHNEKLKAQLDKDKLTEEEANDPRGKNTTSDVSVKGTGAGHHNTTGD